MKTLRLILFVLVSTWILGCNSSEESGLIGTAAPEIRLESIREPGKFVSMADYKGKVLMIDFWATWCGPCIESMPGVQKLWDKYHSQGLEIAGVTTEDRVVATKFLAMKPLTYPFFLDGNASVNESYKVTEIPTVVIVDRKGKVAFLGHPEDPGMVTAIENSLKG